MKDLPRFLADLPSREGAHAVYLEPPFIAYVRVSKVEGDDWGVKADIAVLPTPGMCDNFGPSLQVSGSWEFFSNIHHHWHVRLANWSVYFGEKHIQVALELAGRAASHGSRVTLLEMRRALEDCYDL